MYTQLYIYGEINLNFGAVTVLGIKEKKYIFTKNVEIKKMKILEIGSEFGYGK